MAYPHAFHAKVALLGGILLVPACGGTSDSTALGAGTGPKLSELPQDLGPALCDVVKQCLGAEYDALFRDQSCTEKQIAAIEESDFSLLESAVDRHTAMYDGTKVNSCLDAIGQAGCTVLTKRLTSLCAGVITGTVAADGDCTLNAECKDGLFCQTDSTCPGKCKAPLGEGATCEKSEWCKDGLVCSDKSKSCIQPVAVGGACGGTSGKECPFDLVCVGAAAAATGTCNTIDATFAGSEGAACDPTMAVFCKSGLSCTFTSLDQAGTAVWKCEKPAASQACHLGYPEPCPSGQFCQLAGASVDSGTCKPLPGDGDACETHVPVDPKQPKDLCASTATCVGGATCKTIQHLGGACATEAECISKLCKAGKCVASDCSSAASSSAKM